MIIGIAILAYIMAHAAIYDTQGDSMLSLCVSQAFVQGQSVRLDAYAQNIPTGYQMYKHGDHVYPYYPIGGAWAVAPFVAVENMFGHYITGPDHVSDAMQLRIVFIINSCIFIILYLIAGIYWRPLHAFALAGLFMFGTSLLSSMSKGLLNTNMTVLFTVLLIAHIMRYEKGRTRHLNGCLVGVLLFCVYVCKPTGALLVLAVFGYMMIRDKRMCVFAMGMSGALFAAFMAWSWYEFGQLLPAYYMPNRLDGGNVFVALCGNFFSPSRGLFIFSPFLFLTVYALYIMRSTIAKKPFVIAMIAWMMSHILVVSWRQHWWGGYMYGARMLTEIVPGLFALTLISWDALYKQAKKNSKRIFLALVVLMSICAGYIHIWQGMFNAYPILWNDMPNIDTFPAYLFDWKYPQFLHTEKRHAQRWIQHIRQTQTATDIPVPSRIMEYTAFLKIRQPIILDDNDVLLLTFHAKQHNSSIALPILYDDEYTVLFVDNDVLVDRLMTTASNNSSTIVTVPRLSQLNGYTALYIMLRTHTIQERYNYTFDIMPKTRKNKVIEMALQYKHDEPTK